MKRLLILLLLVIGVAGCSDPKEGENFRMAELDPIATGLAAIPEYSMFVEMLKEVDVYNALNLTGNYTFTVFVPSNDAVEEYLQLYGYESLEDMDYDDKEYLVKYHIVSGIAIAEADLYLQLSMPTVTGKYLTANISTETGSRYIDNGDDKYASTIIVGDMEYLNGYAHEVDHMLQPVTLSIWDIVAENEDYTIFADLLQMCGLGGYSDLCDANGNVVVAADTMLFNRYETTLNGVTITEDKTLFVVPDDVFDKNKINVAELMLDKYPAGSDELWNYTADLHQWVLYHAMYGAIGYSTLTTFPSQYSESLFPDQSHNLETMVSYAMLSIIDDNNVIYLNPHAGTESGNVQLLDWDTPAKNGTVHLVDGMLNIPDEVGSYTFVWDPLTSKQEFQTLSYYGYENRTDLSAIEEYIVKSGELLVSIPGLSWNSVPATSANIYYRNTGVEYLSNGDALIFELGLTGYVDITTPVLATDTYTVYRVLGTDTGLTDTGYAKMTIDGSSLSAATSVDFEIDADDEETSYTPTTMGSITFTEDATHTMRFEPTGTSGQMSFDLVIFKP